MADIIILLLVLVVLILAVRGTLKHFKGEGACCGGGTKGLIKEEDKTLENKKIGEKLIKIEGMHCDNCRQRVAAALNKVHGASAKVDLKKKLAVVSYDRPVEESALKKAVEDAGYKVVSIE